MAKFSLAVHGGAGTIERTQMTAAQEEAYHAGLRLALSIGEKLLTEGTSAILAVEATVMSLEDNPLFNAGRGAVFNHEGRHSLEASIMCGATLNAGAVAGIERVKNPICMARHVMDYSDFVFMIGAEAEGFAKEQKLELRDPAYFFTDHRYEQWQAMRHSQQVLLDHDAQNKTGTVGAVALDLHGNLAAATSTGGLTNKSYGRVGDTPVIGSGNYAENGVCAVSCTGYGEFFLRTLAAYDIAARMKYKGISLADACHEVVQQRLLKMGGEGGVIAIDAEGNIVLNFNSSGMYRGEVSSAKPEIITKIYR